MDYDQSELLSAMYQNDDTLETKPDVQIDPSGFQRTRKIKVGAIGYEVPTPEYVNRLEQLITSQARVIERQQNELARLTGFMNSTRNFIRRQTVHITEMQHILDGKVDQRDYV